MIPLTLGQVARAVGGRLHQATGAERVSGSVEFDSRRVGPGGLFVALPGTRVDGHDFAAAAHAAGAAGVLAAREVDAPAVLARPVPAGDPARSYVLAALAALARSVIDVLPDLTVIGITGSSGKTSTKDLVAALLAPSGPTVAPPGSFNNELGHPWTALRCDGATRHLVLELSARGPGHVAALCATAPPRIGVVLNVGSAHLGEFGSRAAIAAAKGELVAALPHAASGGVAVLNADDPAVAAMATRTAARVVTVGRCHGADVRAAAVTLDAAGRPRFRLLTPLGAVAVALRGHGEHWVGNALAAAAVALECGVGFDAVAAGLAAAVPTSRWRMEVSDRPDGVRVVNDAYNANPESVRAALGALRRMSAAGTSRGRRSWAVLGEMGELGDFAPAAHAEIGRLAAESGVDHLVVVGEGARPLHDAALSAGSRDSVLVADVRAAVALLSEAVRPGDIVLVKASRAVGLERVAQALLDVGTDRAEHGSGS